MKFCVLMMGVLPFFAFSSAVKDSEECGEEQAIQCVTSKVGIFGDDGKVPSGCEILTHVQSCFLQLVGECLDEDEQEEAQKQIAEMANKVREVCESEDQYQMQDIDEDDGGGTDEEMFECLDDEDQVTWSAEYCMGKSVQEHLRAPPMANSHDAQCIMILSIARCTAKELAHTCGEDVETPVFHGIMLALAEEEPAIAESPECAAVIREIPPEDDDNEVKRKRRHMENFSISKLLKK